VDAVTLVMNDNAEAERQRLRRQRMRSLAIALALGALVALFYVATIVRMGGNALNRAM
jgi:thiol:disulfide interchange protein